MKRISWDGLWWIEQPYGGLCVLKQIMHQVFGDYAYRGGKLEGKIRGRTLTGMWEEDTVRSDKFGRFRLVISHDGKTIVGHWWYGDRVTPPASAQLWEMSRKGLHEFELKGMFS